MRRRYPVMLFVMIAAFSAGCGGETGPTETPVAKVAAEPSVEGVQEVAVAAQEPVEVEADGREFDPAVEKAQIPEGAWYCDMGTVHFARLEQGDGKCPRCGMNLVHKGAESAEVSPG